MKVLTNSQNKVYVSGDKALLVPSGYYSELPSYQVTSGVVYRRSGTLPANLFSGITSISDYGLYYAYYGCSGLTGFDLSNLITVGSSGLFSAFTSCTGLIGSIDLSKITSIGPSGCRSFLQYCSGITIVYLNSVSSIGSTGFYLAFCNCSAITDIYFNGLTTTSFGSYVNQFNNMFNSTTASTSGNVNVHFPSNLQSTIAGLTGYPLFGGTSGRVTLLFDLAATS